MRKKMLLATGALVAGLTMSGCLAQTGFHWSNAQPKKGKSTKGIIEAKGVEGGGIVFRGGEAKAYYFVALQGEGEGVTLKSFKFDKTETFGKPQKMIEDAALSANGSSACGPSGGVVYRTKNPVAYSPVDKLVETHFKAKMAEEGGGFAGYVATGHWLDDGDGTPEPTDSSDDSYECAGFASTYLSTKGFSPTTGMRELADR